MVREGMCSSKCSSFQGQHAPPTAPLTLLLPWSSGTAQMTEAQGPRRERRPPRWSCRARWVCRRNPRCRLALLATGPEYCRLSCYSRLLSTSAGSHTASVAEDIDGISLRVGLEAHRGEADGVSKLVVRNCPQCFPNHLRKAVRICSRKFMNKSLICKVESPGEKLGTRVCTGGHERYQIRLEKAARTIALSPAVHQYARSVLRVGIHARLHSLRLDLRPVCPAYSVGEPGLTALTLCSVQNYRCASDPPTPSTTSQCSGCFLPAKRAHARHEGSAILLERPREVHTRPQRLRAVLVARVRRQVPAARQRLLLAGSTKVFRVLFAR